MHLHDFVVVGPSFRVEFFALFDLISPQAEVLIQSRFLLVGELRNLLIEILFPFVL